MHEQGKYLAGLGRNAVVKFLMTSEGIRPASASQTRRVGETMHVRGR